MGQKVRTGLLWKCLAIFLATQMAACATLLYLERRGQPVGRLDVGVVALDAVGLLVFFVPGVIAFVVDFATGAIYLPPDRVYVIGSAPGQPLQTVHVHPEDLTPKRLEMIVNQQTGKTIHLEEGTYKAAKISQIEDFNATTLERLQSGPVSSKVVFRGSSE